MPPSQPSLAISFLYYRDLARAEAFYRDVLGFELVIDQGWAKFSKSLMAPTLVLSTKFVE